jgi:hypothetical protein
MDSRKNMGSGGRVRVYLSDRKQREATYLVSLTLIGKLHIGDPADDGVEVQRVWQQPGVGYGKVVAGTS